MGLQFQWKWMRRDKLLVLFWSFTAAVLLNHFFVKFSSSPVTQETTNQGTADQENGTTEQETTTNQGTTEPWTVQQQWLIFVELLATLVFPVAGWLADVYVGRYKMIKTSMWIMLVSSVLFSVELGIQASAWEPSKTVRIALMLATALLGCLGLAGFQANIIQFCMDQLQESPSVEISSFVVFYTLCFISANVLVSLISSCVCQGFTPLANLLLPILLGLSVSSDLLFNRWLVKEPITHNPLKLIFKVLYYTAKNKHPFQRSAFTYWDDKPFSRIDVAKNKYGGPFTTEQVEDVKTFFKVLGLGVITCLFVGLLENSKSISFRSHEFSFHGLLGECAPDGVLQSRCLRVLVLKAGPIVFLLSLPLWELLVFPLLWKCTMRFRILTRLAIGMSLLLLFLLSLISIELYGQTSWHYRNSIQNSNETTAPFCPLSPPSPPHPIRDHHYPLPYAWLALPSILYTAGTCIVGVAMIEFMSSQCPYSMKGLMLGLFYLVVGISICIFYPLSLLFSSKALRAGFATLNCAFWYLLTCTVLALAIGVAFLAACFRYRNRQREDDLPTQQFLADIYSRRKPGHLASLSLNRGDV